MSFPVVLVGRFREPLGDPFVELYAAKLYDWMAGILATQRREPKSG
jgi:hypothetical protein